jgi:hypothetical protein
MQKVNAIIERSEAMQMPLNKSPEPSYYQNRLNLTGTEPVSRINMTAAEPLSRISLAPAEPLSRISLTAAESPSQINTTTPKPLGRSSSLAPMINFETPDSGCRPSLATRFNLAAGHGAASLPANTLLVQSPNGNGPNFSSPFQVLFASILKSS